MHCTPLTEMTYAAKLLNWGFAMEGKVKPVGTLVRPLPSPAPAHSATPRATPPAAAHHVARLAKASGFPAVPVAAGGGLLVAVGLIATGIVLMLRLRRQQRGGSPPGP
jgi:serine-type D-Ala-D-Ala carboxypeptidase (penicillin-binding protein 5/6)